MKRCVPRLSRRSRVSKRLLLRVAVLVGYLCPHPLSTLLLFEQYMPTIGDMYTKDVEVNGAPRHVEIDDTAGQEAYADLKKEKMSTGDVSLGLWGVPHLFMYGA